MRTCKLNLMSGLMFSLSAEENVVLEAGEAAEKFQAKMEILFPNFMCSARIKTILGDNVAILFANVKSRSDAPNGIMQNVSGFMNILMSLEHEARSTKQVYTIEHSVGKRVQSFGVKQFRKITAKTPTEALDKLFKWFQANADAIRNMPVSIY